MKALSALSKFLGLHSDFQVLVKAYGLKWRSSTSEELILSRMQNTLKKGDVIGWIKQVKGRLPQLVELMELVSISGLRFTEAVSSYNLIISLSEKRELEKYYDFENQILAHYRFKEIFIRRTKKALVSFAPSSLIERISKKDRLTLAQINNRIRRANLKSRFGDVREYFATFMTQFLNPAEIDFLQGRVSASVFMRNYFNPALLGDLRQRVFRGINEMQKVLYSED